MTLETVLTTRPGKENRSSSLAVLLREMLKDYKLRTRDPEMLAKFRTADTVTLVIEPRTIPVCCGA
jgi:hypothetical protein